MQVFILYFLYILSGFFLRPHGNHHGFAPVTKEAIQSTLYAFAALLSDGHVVTWGDANNGGDSGSWSTKAVGTGIKGFWGDEHVVIFVDCGNRGILYMVDWTQ